MAADGDIDEAGAALIAYFLWLTETFVGPSMALRLVTDAWPQIVVDGRD